MARTKSSQRWLKRHFSDVHVLQAQKLGYRSRAAFKLLEIQEQDRILRPGMTVVDLGAAPGGWSQIAAPVIGKKGRVIALDVLVMDPLPEVEFLLGDFTEEEVLNRLLQTLHGKKIDLVISDMAPNISGMKSVDQPRAMYLAELALDFACKVLVPGGNMLVKVFEGSGIEEFRKEARSSFKSLAVRKPKASRPSSREVYVLARNFIVT